MLVEYNPIYEEDYDTLRQQQAHFSFEKSKIQTDFYLRGEKYRRTINSFHFNIDMFHGYDMYLPIMSVVNDLTVSSIGEWNWNTDEKKWVFYKNRSAEKFDGINWQDPELNNLIEEGTQILEQEKYAPDKYG